MTPTELMAAFAAALIVFVLGWCRYKMVLERREAKSRQQRYPEAKLTTNTDRLIIRLYLDENEKNSN